MKLYYNRHFPYIFSGKINVSWKYKNLFVNKLKDLQKSPGTDQNNPGLSKEEKEERDARIRELISKFKAARVGAEESKKLGNMGEELKDKNSSDGKDDEGKTEDDSTEPDVSPEEE